MMRRILRRRAASGEPRVKAPRRPRSARAWLAFLAAFWPFILGAVLVAGGLAAIVIGYLGAAGTLVVGLQVPYVVSGGLLGLALVVLGTGLLILQAMTRQAQLTRRLLEETRERGGPAAVGGVGPSADGVVVATRGGRLFHRPDCLLVEGKDVRRLKVGSAATRRLEPCRVCDPPARVSS